MPTNHDGSVIQFLRAVRPVTGPTDGELLGRFVTLRDGSAFAELLRRHGPMVLSTCRRLLRHEQDAEDAFQAAFLVLARKAESVRPRAAVGGWLYGVACYTAQAARRRRRRRQQPERPMDEAPDRAAPVAPESVWDELVPLLDRELGRLPEKYRLAVVLCELEGRPRKEVARQLGIPEGTLSSRLAAARKLLARRLGPSGAGLAAVLSPGLARVAVPAPLAASTLEAASRFAAGQVVAGALRPGVALLMEGVMKAMLIRKLGIATTFVLAALLVAGVGTFAHQALAGDGPATTATPASAAPAAAPRTLPPQAATAQPAIVAAPPAQVSTAQPTTARTLPPSTASAENTQPAAPPPPQHVRGVVADPTKRGPAPDRRFEDLVRQVELLQKKVDTLEKELRSLRGRPGGTSGGGTAPALPSTPATPGAPSSTTPLATKTSPAKPPAD
jgi:RNA polymerase sigma factor (sigma-70 family)